MSYIRLVYYFMTIKSHENWDKLINNQWNLSTTNNIPYELGLRLSNMLFQSLKSLNKLVIKNRLKSLLLKFVIYSLEEFITHCTSGEVYWVWGVLSFNV